MPDQRPIIVRPALPVRAARIYRVPDASSGLLRLMQECFALSDLSLHAFARRSGIPIATLSRHLHRDQQREFVLLEALLAALGLAVACRDREGVWHPIVRAPARRLRTSGAARSAVLPTLCTTFGIALRAVIDAAGLSLRGLARVLGASYGSVRRAVQDASGSAASQLLCALIANGHALRLQTTAGDIIALSVSHWSAHDRDGTRRSQAHSAALRRYRERHLLHAPVVRMPVRRGCARPRLDPVRVLELHQAQELSCSAIARQLGVSSERVRQVLIAAGCPSQRVLRVRARQAIAQPRLLAVGSAR